MDVDLEQLNPLSLPAGELKFVRRMLSISLPAYSVGFQAENLTRRLMSENFDFVNQYQNVALLRIGSGGRFEGAALGEIELVLLTTPELGNSHPIESIQGLINRVEIPFLSPFEGYVQAKVEHKKIEGEASLSYYPGQKLPYPGRVLEGELIAGNVRVQQAAIRRVFQEIKSDSSIVEGLKKSLRQHAKVCETGISRSTAQFDLETASVFYDPDNKQYGLKYGVLRYIQLAISLEIFGLIRRRELGIDEVLDLNQSVEERIRYAFRKGWVRRTDELIELGLIYARACDEQLTLKINHHRSGSTSSQCANIEAWNTSAISLCSQQLLLD